jgi:hypothetical protein
MIFGKRKDMIFLLETTSTYEMKKWIISVQFNRKGGIFATSRFL